MLVRRGRRWGWEAAAQGEGCRCSVDGDWRRRVSEVWVGQREYEIWWRPALRVQDLGAAVLGRGVHGEGDGRVMKGMEAGWQGCG